MTTTYTERKILSGWQSQIQSLAFRRPWYLLMTREYNWRLIKWECDVCYEMRVDCVNDVCSLPMTLRVKVLLIFGTVETWHSYFPSSLVVTYLILSVCCPCRPGINSYRSSWTNRSNPMKRMCLSELRTQETWPKKQTRQFKGLWAGYLKHSKQFPRVYM